MFYILINNCEVTKMCVQLTGLVLLGLLHRAHAAGHVDDDMDSPAGCAARTKVSPLRVFSRSSWCNFHSSDGSLYSPAPVSCPSTTLDRLWFLCADSALLYICRFISWIILGVVMHCLTCRGAMIALSEPCLVFAWTLWVVLDRWMKFSTYCGCYSAQHFWMSGWNFLYIVVATMHSTSECLDDVCRLHPTDDMPIPMLECLNTQAQSTPRYCRRLTDLVLFSFCRRRFRVRAGIQTRWNWQIQTTWCRRWEHRTYSMNLSEKLSCLSKFLSAAFCMYCPLFRGNGVLFSF